MNPPTQVQFNQKNFYIAQLNTEQISHNAYYIQSNKQAVIINPLRDIDFYINLSRERQSQIRYVFLTHIPSNYVSGHLDLVAETGASVVLGPGTTVKFKAHLSKDDEEFKIGQIVLKTISTPGHTPESCCYALNDGKRTAALFTGNTILLGDVGRPDVSQLPKQKNIGADDLAGWLYDSLRGKILLTFQDDVTLYPGHSKGSLYASQTTAGTHDLLGNQKKSNPYLQKMLRNDFAGLITADMIQLPEVYYQIALINQDGPTRYNDIFGISNTPIKIEEAIALAKNPDVLIIDSRNVNNFSKDYIPGSINIDLESKFSLFACDVVNAQKEILVVAEEGDERVTIGKLLRVGIQKIRGYLKGGFASWRDMDLPTDCYDIVSPAQFQDIQSSEEVTVIDLRGIEEVQVNGCIKDSINIDFRFFINFFKENPSIIPQGNDTFFYCLTGKKSSIIISILQQFGQNNVFNISGGFTAILQETPDMVVKNQ